MKQQEILDFLVEYRKDNNFFPSRKEIADYFKVSTKAVQDHLQAIEKKGRIKINQNTARAYEILDENFCANLQRNVKIPILGNISAGYPIFSEEVFEDYIEVAQDQLPANQEFFALHVRGDSMIDAGIFDEDIAIIQKTSVANNGDIVAASINEESVTLKRFFLDQNRIKLKAENKAYPSLYTNNATILGTLKFIIREY